MNPILAGILIIVGCTITGIILANILNFCMNTTERRERNRIAPANTWPRGLDLVAKKITLDQPLPEIHEQLRDGDIVQFIDQNGQPIIPPDGHPLEHKLHAIDKDTGIYSVGQLKSTGYLQASAAGAIGRAQHRGIWLDRESLGDEREAEEPSPKYECDYCGYQIYGQPPKSCPGCSGHRWHRIRDDEIQYTREIDEPDIDPKGALDYLECLAKKTTDESAGPGTRRSDYP